MLALEKEQLEQRLAAKEATMKVPRWKERGSGARLMITVDHVCQECSRS